MGDVVELAFRRAALAMIPRGKPVLAAVSGGGDSVAMLHLLVRHAGGRPVPITVGHLDHALRRGSASDRKFVERLAASLGLPCVSERRPVAEARRRGESPEEAARRVRRSFLLEAARASGAERIVTGHTLDDQAETVLMRLVRGAGASALAGMSATGPGPFVRPLLEIERAKLRAWLRRLRIPFRDDPTNRSLRYDRNRVRLLALPLLAETLNPRAARHLVDAAARLREDAAYLDEQATAALEGATRNEPGGGFGIEVAALAGPPPLARRIARLALQRAGVQSKRVSARHVEALLALARGQGGKRLDLPHGVRAERRKHRILLG